MDRVGRRSGPGVYESRDGAAAFAAVRDYYQQYPKATEVAPSRIVLRLWPRYTKSFGGLHWLDDCTRKWHDLSFRISPVRAEADKDGKHVSYGHLAWVAAWVYRHYGDQRFRTMIDGMNPTAYPYFPRAYTGYYPERSDKSAPEAIKDLTAKSLGGGRVQLFWTAPAGQPVRYQVKWVDLPMVERLNWPDQKGNKANWWAANHVAGEPKPGPAGAKESMVVEGIPAGRRCFAVRSFDAASNRSGIGNLTEVEVR